MVSLDGVDEGGGLQPVAACVGARLLLDFARIDGRLHTAHNQTRPQAFDEVVAKGNGLREVVSGVDVDEGHGDAARREGFGREMGHHDAVLSSGKEDGRTVKLGRDFAQHIDGLGFEFRQMVKVVSGVAHVCQSVKVKMVCCQDGVALSLSSTRPNFPYRNQARSCP